MKVPTKRGNPYHVPDGGVPLIFKLEPGARVARLTVKQDNPYDEHVAFGSFEVVSVKRPDRWSSDPVEVTIRQRSLIRNA